MIQLALPDMPPLRPFMVRGLIYACVQRVNPGNILHPLDRVLVATADQACTAFRFEVEP